MRHIWPSEFLTFSQLLEICLAFHCICLFLIFYHWSLSWARRFNSRASCPSSLRSVLILSPYQSSYFKLFHPSRVLSHVFYVTRYFIVFTLRNSLAKNDVSYHTVRSRLALLPPLVFLDMSSVLLSQRWFIHSQWHQHFTSMHSKTKLHFHVIK
jgi:hypothetical protein